MCFTRRKGKYRKVYPDKYVLPKETTKKKEKQDTSSDISSRGTNRGSE
jgi:hypothetical protein